MAKTQKFSASVNFGAQVDGSVGRALNQLTGGIDDVSQHSMKALGVQTKWMRDLQSGSATSVNRVKTLEQATAALLKKQESLEKQIRDGAKAGKDVKSLATDYQRVAVGISRATKELEQLNAAEARERRRAELSERFRNRVAGFGRGTLKGVGGLAGGAAGTLLSATKWAGAGLLGGAAAAVASPLILNQQTAETAGLARSYGLTVEQYQNMGALARQAGLNGENAGDLSEELKNKVKEVGNEKTLNPMLAQIGLTKRYLSKLDPAAAFNVVMSRLSRMKDAGAAASLGDQLMGGEANKYLTYLRSTGKTFEQAMRDAQRFNLLTKEGAEGAQRANTAVGNLWGVAITGMQDTVGKITGQLAPSIDAAALGLAEWIKDLQPKITSAVTEWLQPDQSGETGPQRLWGSLVQFGEGVEKVGSVIMAVAEKLEWLLPDESAANADRKKITDYLAQGNSLDGAKLLASQSGQEEWLSAQHYDDPAVLDALRASRRDRANVPDYVTFDDSTFGGRVPAVGKSVQNKNQNTFNFNVTLQGGATEDAATTLHEKFQDLLKNNPAFSPTYDVPGF